MQNPLLQISFRLPFDQVEAKHVEPAVQQLLSEARNTIAAITTAEPARTYANTLEPLADGTATLDYAVSISRHLESVATTPEFRAAYNAIEGPVAEFHSSLPLNEALWKAINEFAQTPEGQQLSGAQARYLNKTIDDFRREGAGLDAEGKKRLAAIDVELAEITTKYSQNVLDATSAWELLVEVEDTLAGLPPSAVAAARQSAQAKQLPGWRFTLHAPSYTPVMMYLDDVLIRRKMYLAANARAAGGDFDNRPLIARILELRKERASLLGFGDFADLVLADRMARTGDAAHAFVADLRTRTLRHFEQENEALLAFSGQDSLAPWEVAYWAEKQRRALYDFDEEALRPYFAVERVMAGMYSLFGSLFGIRVEERTGVPVWDKAVQCFDILDTDGRLLGAFYTDWFPRDNKRQGAWMDAMITAAAPQPNVGVICGNLTPPLAGKPALLTHTEVETIFHEFGHLLHHMLSNVPVRPLAGTNVAWDFVELPSQIMENWCWERAALDLFARHYETGEAIPNELFVKMRRARNFRAANAQMRQLGFATVDLALHREFDPARDSDAVAYARRMLAEFSPVPLPEEHAMIASFTHLFGNPVGYGAGYYSYKWAEVLEADAFTRFEREGLFNQQVGGEFRERLLSRGASAEPASLFRAFMGRDPDPSALLRRSGLVEMA